MADTLTSITNLINSPPGQVVAGGALFAITWKFFQGAESVLTDDTKLEIAVWLLDRKKLSPTFQSWPDTFAKVFDRVFGQKHLSWKCFRRSCLASSVVICLVLLVSLRHMLKVLSQPQLQINLLCAVPLATMLPDYVSLLETRWTLGLMRRTNRTSAWIAFLLIDASVTALIAGFTAHYLMNFAFELAGSIQGYYSFQIPFRDMIIELSNQTRFFLRHPLFIIESHLLLVSSTWLNGVRMPTFNEIFFVPVFFTSVWLWLYAASGLILKAARRFDIGFQWFNRKFDIEKKPLSSIGLVAGCLVALLYWTAALIRHFV
jgi:hypothetical protein